MTSDLSSIVNADGTRKSFTYIDSGPPATINDENHTTGADYTYMYDIAGRRLKEIRFLTGSSSGVVTQFGYDTHDNIVSQTDANANVTTFHVDDYDRATKQTSPVEGVSTYGYDADSNVISTSQADGSSTSLTYDSLNRPLTETDKKGSVTLSSSLSYDDATSGHFGIGRLATISDPSGSSGYSYERRGHVEIENRSIVGASYTQAYTFDGNANTATQTYPDGYVVTDGYDFADRPYSAAHSSTLTSAKLSSLSAGGEPAPSHSAVPEVMQAVRPQSNVVQLAIGSVRGARGVSRFGSAPRVASTIKPDTSSPDSFVTATSYEPFGQVQGITFGNGTTQSLTWNSRYFPLENKLSSTTTLADYSYTEDHVGNITGLTDKVNANYSRSFAYDDLNRLTTANSGTGLWGTASGNGYTYDAMGNVKSIQLGTTYKATFAYRAGVSPSVGLPEIQTVTENGTARTVSYDAHGNELGDSGSTFTYSPRELLATDSRYVTAYYYDFYRRRLSTSLASGGTHRTSFFDPHNMLFAETNEFTTGAPSIAYKYIWLGDRPVAQVDSGGTHWTFADHLGTPLIQTSSAGAITYQAEYEPFGGLFSVRTGGALHQPLRFPGQSSEQFDSGNNGLTERSYNLNRWFRPNWARYTQPDPLGLFDSEDLYSYVSDMPTVASDPSGLAKRPYIRPRLCTPVEIAVCVANCIAKGKIFQSCRISQHYGLPHGLDVGWQAVDGPMSCSCDDPNLDCTSAKRLEQTAPQAAPPLTAPPITGPVGPDSGPPWWDWIIWIIEKAPKGAPVPVPV